MTVLKEILKMTKNDKINTYLDEAGGLRKKNTPQLK